MKRRQLLKSTPALLLPALIGCQGSAGTTRQPDALPDSPPATGEPNRKLGVALLGLGQYAKGQIAPALQLTEHCELRGLITGSPEKLPEWQSKYDIPDANTYTYDRMEELADNDDIDIVYVITPTATHKDFSVRAARAGKHVWCEKPMAMDPAECQAIIDACDQNGVRLAIGYRMLHEPNTQKLIELTQEKAYGGLTSARSLAGYGGNPPPADYWRGQRDMGGGALYDMGVYTVNGFRYGTQKRPVSVLRAEQQRQNRPNGVDLTTTYTLKYADGMEAEGKTSVVEKFNLLRINAEDGWYELDPMQPYNGVKGQTSDGKILAPPVPNQQSLQMDDDALAIMNKTPMLAPGEMGKADIAVIRAIIEAAETRREVEIANI